MDGPGRTHAIRSCTARGRAGLAGLGAAQGAGPTTTRVERTLPSRGIVVASSTKKVHSPYETETRSRPTSGKKCRPRRLSLCCLRHAILVCISLLFVYQTSPVRPWQHNEYATTIPREAKVRSTSTREGRPGRKEPRPADEQGVRCAFSI